MTKNMKLLLSGSSVALLGVLALQGCGSGGDDSATPSTAGKPSAGGTTSTAGGTTSTTGGTTSTTGGTTSTTGGGGATATGGGGATATGGGGATATGGGGATSGGSGGASGGSGGKGGSGGASGGSGGKGGAGGASGGSGGKGGSGGSSGGGNDCMKFCADEMTTCGFGPAASNPYTANDACMTACAAFGTTGMNNFACRRTHLTNAAASPAAKMTHCPHTAVVSSNTFGGPANGPCN